jgi:hypothetical protein
VTDSAATPQQVIYGVVQDSATADAVVAALEAAGYQVKRLAHAGWGLLDSGPHREGRTGWWVVDQVDIPHPDHPWVPVWVEGSP